MSEQHDTQTWPDLAIALYDRLTGRGAEISYEFENLELHVPERAGGSAQPATAPWKINGVLKIRTRNVE